MCNVQCAANSFLSSYSGLIAAVTSYDLGLALVKSFERAFEARILYVLGTLCVRSSALTSEVCQGLVSQTVKTALFNQSRARTPNILRALAQLSGHIPPSVSTSAMPSQSAVYSASSVVSSAVLGDSSPAREASTPTTRMDVE